jgi:hypothetical protein
MANLLAEGQRRATCSAPRAVEQESWKLGTDRSSSGDFRLQ